MIQVTFRFYGDLNDLLPAGKRQRDYTAPITLRSSVKDAVESQGVPHPEVALLLLNGYPATWTRRLEDGDRLTTYPLPADSTLLPGKSLWVDLEYPPRFLLDVHLGRLAAYLRLLGFDTLYHSLDIGDNALVREAHQERRVLLTSDRQLLMHNLVPWGRVIRSRDPKVQAVEILDRFQLRPWAKPFTRCMKCNGILDGTSPETVLSQAPERVLERFGVAREYYRACVFCGRLYWPGSHWERMRRLLVQWKVEDDGSQSARTFDSVRR